MKWLRCAQSWKICNSSNTRRFINNSSRRRVMDLHSLTFGLCGKGFVESLHNQNTTKRHREIACHVTFPVFGVVDPRNNAPTKVGACERLSISTLSLRGSSRSLLWFSCLHSVLLVHHFPNSVSLNVQQMNSFFVVKLSHFSSPIIRMIT